MASLQRRRLPVRPKTRTSESHHREMRSPELKDRSPPKTVHGETVHVSDMPHRYRKTGSLRTSAHEADSVASESKLARPSVLGEKSIPIPKSLHRHLQEDNILVGQPLHPLQHAVQMFTDTSKGRMVCSFRRLYSQRSVVHSRKQTKHQFSGIEGRCFGPETL